MTAVTIETLAAEIRQRLDALASSEDLGALRAEISETRPTDEQIRAAVSAYLDGLSPDDPVIRKLRFGRDGDPALEGSKYGRQGMSLADLELTHDVLASAHQVGVSKQGPTEELRNAVRTLSDARRVPVPVARADDERHLEALRSAGILRGAGYIEAMRALDGLYGRAMDTAETGFGLELVGTQYVRELWAGAQAASRVFALIRMFPMTDATAFLPVEAAVPEMLFVAESTEPASADYATSKTPSQRVQVTAKKLLIHQMWSGEMEEDSLVPYIPFLRAQATRSAALHADSLVLNGDTTNAATGNINLDDADPADTKHYLAFDGIRHAALVDNVGNSSDVAGPVTYRRLLEARGLLLDAPRDHDWGHPDMPEDLVYVSDPETADRVALLDEVITVDKFGEAATVATGQQARIGLHPLISSSRLAKTEADGKVSTTAANNTKGQMVVFNRTGFVVGVRRQLRVETERLPGRDQSRIVYSLRIGFGRYTPTGSASGIEAAAVLRNISL